MEIYRKALELLEDEQPFALLMVVGATGSTPQKLGAKALVDAEGRLLAGTIGGGLMESRALAKGAQVIQEKAGDVFEFAMDEPYSRDAGPICGGTMRVLAVPGMRENRDSYAAVLNALSGKERGLILTALKADGVTGQSRWVPEATIGNGGGADSLRAFLENERGGVHVDESTRAENFVEPVVALPQMLIVGGGHVGQAIARQAVWLGYHVTVLDDRPDFARPELFPEQVTPICGDIREEVQRFPKTADSYIVLVSKGHKPDAEALEGCIHSNPAYIGMIGSKRKVALLRTHFLESGLAREEEFGRVFAPIGLDIGAVTVEEIATSVMAQVVAVRRLGREGYRAVDKVLR